MLCTIRRTCDSESLELMRISAPAWIVDNGFLRSWTMDVISGRTRVGSLRVLEFIRSFLVFVVLPCLSEVFPQECNQVVFGKEFRLSPGIYFLHRAFELAASADLPKLNYECPSH